MHVKIGNGGRLIIPATFRKAMNLHTGDELIIRMVDGELRLFRQLNALQRIKFLAKECSNEKNHTEQFLDFRKRDQKE